MSKVGKTVAQKLASLRNIPPSLIPSTLKHQLVLQNISQIKLEYSRSARQFGPLYLFFRKHVADLRYHNPKIKIVRNATQDGPLVARIVLVSRTGKGSEQELTILSNQVKTLEDLREKILNINNELV